jgi:hypothetical protein
MCMGTYYYRFYTVGGGGDKDKKKTRVLRIANKTSFHLPSICTHYLLMLVNSHK